MLNVSPAALPMLMDVPLSVLRPVTVIDAAAALSSAPAEANVRALAVFVPATVVALSSAMLTVPALLKFSVPVLNVSPAALPMLMDVPLRLVLP